MIWLPGVFSRISLTGPFQESIEHWEFGIAHPFLFVESYISKKTIHFIYKDNLVCTHKNIHQFDKKYSYWIVIPSMRSFRFLLPQIVILLTQRIAAFHNLPEIQSIDNITCNKRLKCKGKRLSLLQNFDDAFSAVCSTVAEVHVHIKFYLPIPLRLC